MLLSSDSGVNVMANLLAEIPGADKSLAQPGRKQTRKYIMDARDFNNIETLALMKVFFSARQGAEGNSSHYDKNITLFPSWSG